MIVKKWILNERRGIFSGLDLLILVLKEKYSDDGRIIKADRCLSFVSSVTICFFAVDLFINAIEKLYNKLLIYHDLCLHNKMQ